MPSLCSVRRVLAIRLRLRPWLPGVRAWLPGVVLAMRLGVRAWLPGVSRVTLFVSLSSGTTNKGMGLKDRKDRKDRGDRATDTDTALDIDDKPLRRFIADILETDLCLLIADILETDLCLSYKLCTVKRPSPSAAYLFKPPLKNRVIQS